MGGHPVPLRGAAAAWEHMARPGIITFTPSSSAQSTNTANRLSRCAFRTTEHFRCLPLPRFPQALHPLGTPPRNTIFAQTSSRVGMHGRRGSQLFLLSCLWWAQLGKGIHQPPGPACQPQPGPAADGTPQLRPVPPRGPGQSAQKKALCVCMWSPGLQQGASQQMWA